MNITNDKQALVSRLSHLIQTELPDEDVVHEVQQIIEEARGRIEDDASEAARLFRGCPMKDISPATLDATDHSYVLFLPPRAFAYYLPLIIYKGLADRRSDVLERVLGRLLVPVKPEKRMAYLAELRYVIDQRCAVVCELLALVVRESEYFDYEEVRGAQRCLKTFWKQACGGAKPQEKGGRERPVKKK